MFKKSLLLLTATAVMLPLTTVSADDRKDRKERVRAEKAQNAPPRQRVNRSRAQQRQARAPRGQRSQQRQPGVQRPERSDQISRTQAPRQVRDPSLNNREINARTEARANQQARQNTRQNTRRTARPSDRQQTRQQVRQDNRQTARQNPNRGSRQVSRAQVRQDARQQTRERARQTQRQNQRQATRTNSRGAGRYDYNDAARYDGARARASARNARVDRYRDRGSYRYRDTHRRADPYQPRVRRNVYRNYFYPRFGNSVFFGFGGFYTGPRYSLGFYDPFWPYFGSYYNAYNYYDYYSHWPFARGFYGHRASWGWAHRHNHYHYGDYCPGFHHDDGHHYGHSNYRYTNGSGDNVAGTLLGAVVGGIIGAEIDGGRNRTAGAIAGAVVGATIGNAATRNNANHHPAPSTGYRQPYSSGARFDENGRHIYETRPYQPPEEVRTCMRYDYRGDSYTCTKWTVEYVYDDDQPAGDR